MTLSRVQQTTIAFDEFGTRARQARAGRARLGALPDISGRRRLRGGNQPGDASGDDAGTVSTTVNCSSTSHVEGGNVVIYTLVATACNQAVGGACPNPAPTADYVERQLQEDTLE